MGGRIERTGLFDAYSYAAGARLTGLSEAALIDHYLESGNHPSASPQPHFDAGRYRRLAGLSGDEAPFIHFALHLLHRPDGLSEEFNMGVYLAENPDVRISGWDPLRHYLEHGWREGRLATELHYDTAIPDFTGLSARLWNPDDALVDVVVPAYRGRAETLSALYSTLTARSTVPFRLVVIDDASPEPALARDLAALEEGGLVHRIVNPRNLGFTVTANIGLGLARERDVVLLNSDTEVFDGWLDRLRTHAYGAADIGTVTPLSNAATILSYPVRLRDNPVPLELSYAELAAMIGRLALGPVEIPTGVGFCLYLRRTCLEAVGPFDEVAYPRGYGEENDFCLRATALGWRHLAAADTFVRHLGSRSFGDERPGLVAAGLERLEASHPGYLAQIDRFVSQDPLAAVRTQLDVARIRAVGHSGRVMHAAALEVRASDDLILRRCAGLPDRFYIHSSAAPNSPNLPDLDPAGHPETALALLRAMGVNEIVVAEPALFGRRQVIAIERLAAGGALTFFQA